FISFFYRYYRYLYSYPTRRSSDLGAEVLLVMNGSPYHAQQPKVREEVLARRVRENGIPLVYVNLVGGQDELVFDGGSLALDAEGQVVFRAPLFEEGVFAVEVDVEDGVPRLRPGQITPQPQAEESVYKA